MISVYILFSHKLSNMSADKSDALKARLSDLQGRYNETISLKKETDDWYDFVDRNDPAYVAGYMAAQRDLCKGSCAKPVTGVSDRGSTGVKKAAATEKKQASGNIMGAGYRAAPIYTADPGPEGDEDKEEDDDGSEISQDAAPVTGIKGAKKAAKGERKKGVKDILDQSLPEADGTDLNEHKAVKCLHCGNLINLDEESP